jgi:endonuclease/exonuclease/phosphatase family metal-dependent hydrolase
LGGQPVVHVGADVPTFEQEDLEVLLCPRAWAEKSLNVDVADRPEWRTLSDHFPLVVETAP